MRLPQIARVRPIDDDAPDWARIPPSPVLGGVMKFETFEVPPPSSGALTSAAETWELAAVQL